MEQIENHKESEEMKQRNDIANYVEEYQKSREGHLVFLNFTVRILRDKKYSMESIKNDYLIDRDKISILDEVLLEKLDNFFDF